MITFVSIVALATVILIPILGCIFYYINCHEGIKLKSDKEVSKTKNQIRKQYTIFLNNDKDIKNVDFSDKDIKKISKAMYKGKPIIIMSGEKNRLSLINPEQIILIREGEF